MELGLVFDAVEDEWLSRREYYYLLGEVAVRGIVEGVCEVLSACIQSLG